MRRTISIVASAIWALGMAAPVRAQLPPTVTVTQVLSNAEAYNGKVVRVHGFITLERENNRLWRDEAAFRNYEPVETIIVHTPGLTRAQSNVVKGRLAFVTGRLKIYSNWGHAETGIDVTDIQRDPADKGPDRGWWSDPEFGKLLGILGGLAIVGLLFGLAARGRAMLSPPWEPARRTLNPVAASRAGNRERL